MKAKLKKIIGRKFWNYCRWYKQTFGLFHLFFGITKFCYSSDYVKVKIIGGKGNVFIRPGTTDLDVYNSIFIDEEFKVDFGSPKFIVDAGAYTGLSSIWFANRYPDYNYCN